ncbi:MAG: DegT/DnrJ/EryC1/StrS family aminotransferase [Hyphomicrobiales bacterium]|nr:DegT/DnrJ/EryC1/StrS family aminotransferase [Hyphomicrobiales bacterium]
MANVFTGNFTQQEPLPERAIARAVEVMRSGRLHRYNTVLGEISETVQLELEFARYTGAKYCLAVTSGGYALATALRAAGIRSGEPVLTNAFTLSPVPGAIAAVSGAPIFVETTPELVIDICDLVNKAVSSKARLLLLSHMRGHIVDMDRLMETCDRLGVAVIEDCAHTMGASWNGVKSGRKGIAGCFSTQTYKHMNSGEGGLVISDDPELMARATIVSGSYMLFGTHAAGPTADTYEEIKYEMPNCSGRMDNLRAAILRVQLESLDESCRRWNERYFAVENELGDLRGLVIPARPGKERFVGSSIQFLTPALTAAGIKDFLHRAKARGVEIKWFGAPEPAGYTSRWESWRYAERQDLSQSARVLDQLCDMRLPLTFAIEDCKQIGIIIRDSFLQSMVTQMRRERFEPSTSTCAIDTQ